MKRKQITLAAATIAVIATFAIVSCKKETNKQVTNNTSNLIEQITANNMDDYLISLKKKMLSAEKSGETISLEQAQHDLENLLNFDFGDASFGTNTVQYDTLHAKLTLSNGQVELSQLATTYSKAVEMVIEAYKNLDLSDKRIHAISCEFKESETKDNDEKDAEIVVITRDFVTPHDYNINDTNDWRPYNHGGMCNGPAEYRGAPEIVENWLNQHPFFQYSCINGGRIYFTDIKYSDVYGHNTYDSTADKYKVFYTCTYVSCLLHEELVYYYYNILDYWVYGGFSPAPSSNHHLINFTITYDDVFDCFEWRVRAIHGILNCTGSDPIL
jgi:hypothetical protein